MGATTGAARGSRVRAAWPGTKAGDAWAKGMSRGAKVQGRHVARGTRRAFRGAKKGVRAVTSTIKGVLTPSIPKTLLLVAAGVGVFLLVGRR